MVQEMEVVVEDSGAWHTVMCRRRITDGDYLRQTNKRFEAEEMSDACPA